MGGGFGVGGGESIQEEEYGCAVILIMDLFEEVVQSPGTCLSIQ